ncbi:hypothetical protein ACTXT7_003643 [Hymenolepis weldensis]
MVNPIVMMHVTVAQNQEKSRKEPKTNSTRLVADQTKNGGLTMLMSVDNLNTFRGGGKSFMLKSPCLSEKARVGDALVTIHVRRVREHMLFEIHSNKAFYL